MITDPLDFLVLQERPCQKDRSIFDGTDMPPTHLPAIFSKAAWRSPVGSFDDNSCFLGATTQDGHNESEPVFHAPQRSADTVTMDLTTQRSNSLATAVPKQGRDSCCHD